MTTDADMAAVTAELRNRIAEALKAQKPVRGHEGFTTAEFVPVVGLSARPGKITILLFNGVEVMRMKAARRAVVAKLDDATTKALYVSIASGVK